MILFFTSLSILLLTMLLLFPVVSSVNKARMKVLSLFVDIPNYHVIALSNKCEKFLSCMHEDQNEDIDSEDGDSGTGQTDDPDYKVAINTRRGGHKIAKNSAKSSKTFFI